MKNNFIIPYFFELHAIFNLHHEFLYAGMIFIHACMFSIPAGKKVLIKNQFIIPDLFYLHAVLNLHYQRCDKGNVTAVVMG